MTVLPSAVLGQQELWQYHSVINRIVVLLAVALLSLSPRWPILLGQSTHRVRPQPQMTKRSEFPQGLNHLLDGQQKARDSGDPHKIAEANRLLVAYLLRASAKLRSLEGRPIEAVALDREALTRVDDPPTHLELATVLMQAGHPTSAVSEADSVLASTPDDVTALRVKAAAFRASGDEKNAEETLKHALTVSPDLTIAYTLGSTMLALHQTAEARALFDQVLQKSGNAAIWHVAVGDAYRDAMYYPDAVMEFKKAIAIDPRAGHAEFFLGYTYLQMNQWGPSSESFKYLREAVRLAPHEYASNFYLGALESTDGSDLVSSDHHLHMAEKADPSKPEVWLYLGLNAVREKDSVAAEQYLRKAVALTGENEALNNYQIKRVYAVLGRLLMAKGERAEGDALLAKYKRTEAMSLRNSSNAIAATAAEGMEGPSLSGLPSPAAVFPGSAIPSPVDPAVKGSSLPLSKPVLPQKTPAQVATEKQLDELLASSLNDLGTAEARMGQYGPAFDDFKAAEQWGPPAPSLLHNTAVAAFRVGNFKESARALDAYLKLKKPSQRGSGADDRSRMMLAMSRFSLGQFAQAEEAFSTIPQVTMQDPRAAYSWAFSMARTGKQQQANKIADALMTQDIPAEDLSLVCHIYVDTENYAQSIPCYQKAYKDDPNLKLAHYQVAEAMIHLDRPQEAVGELRQELALSPDSPNVQYALAYALLQSSQKDEAVALLKKIVAEHPEQADAQYQLGKISLEQGDAQAAIPHLEAAEKSDASSAYVHYQLQAAYRKVGNTADADREAKIYKDMKAAKREIPAERK